LLARVPCTNMIRFFDYREAESNESRSCAHVSGQIIQIEFHTFMTISKGQPMPLNPTPLQLVWGRPRHRRRRPSAGGSEAGPLSGSVPHPHCGACKWPLWWAGASGMGAPEAAQRPSLARRARRTSPPPAAAVDLRPKEGGLHTRGAPGNHPSRPAAAINRPRRRRRRRRRRQPPPPPGGRLLPQVGGLSSTAAAKRSFASCGRPAGASAAARDGGGRRRRGG